VGLDGGVLIRPLSFRSIRRQKGSITLDQSRERNGALINCSLGSSGIRHVQVVRERKYKQVVIGRGEVGGSYLGLGRELGTL